METAYEILTTFVIGASVSYYVLNGVRLLRESPCRLQRVLAVIMFYWALATGKDLLIVPGDFYVSPYTNLVAVADGWTAITFAALVFELSSPSWAKPSRMVAMSVPFVAFTVAYAVTCSDAVLWAYYAFLFLFGVVVLSVGCVRVARYMRYVRAEYSDIEGINLQWFWGILGIFAVSQLLWCICSVWTTRVGDLIYYVMAIVFWEATLRHCRRLRPVLIPPEPAVVEEPAAGSQQFAFAAELQRLIHEEKVYREPGLRLDDLAKRLGTNRTYLCRYFNAVIRATFYDYINGLRITECAIPLIEAHPEYKLEHIATESGFASVGTFRRQFLKVTGMLPSDYAAGRRG